MCGRPPALLLMTTKTDNVLGFVEPALGRCRLLKSIEAQKLLPGTGTGINDVRVMTAATLYLACAADAGGLQRYWRPH